MKSCILMANNKNIVAYRHTHIHQFGKKEETRKKWNQKCERQSDSQSYLIFFLRNHGHSSRRKGKNSYNFPVRPLHCSRLIQMRLRFVMWTSRCECFWWHRLLLRIVTNIPNLSSVQKSSKQILRIYSFNHFLSVLWYSHTNITCLPFVIGPVNEFKLCSGSFRKKRMDKIENILLGKTKKKETTTI